MGMSVKMIFVDFILGILSLILVSMRAASSENLMRWTDYLDLCSNLETENTELEYTRHCVLESRNVGFLDFKKKVYFEEQTFITSYF